MAPQQLSNHGHSEKNNTTIGVRLGPESAPYSPAFLVKFIQIMCQKNHSQEISPLLAIIQAPCGNPRGMRSLLRFIVR